MIVSYQILLTIFFKFIFQADTTLSGKMTFDIRVTYEVSFVGDSSNIDRIQHENAYLLINAEGSLFESAVQNETDSILYFGQENPNNIRRPIPAFLYKILKRPGEIWTYDDLLRTKEDVANQGFKYMEKPEEMVWQLTGEIVQIGNLSCQIARTNFGNRQWAAYFADTIPISDGPYKFAGLPGLIVRLQDDRQHWTFDMISLESGNQSFHATLQSVANYAQTDKLNFFRKRRHVQENYMQMQTASGIRFDDEDMRTMLSENAAESFKSESNWIELYR